MGKVIFHIDLNSFFASAEEVNNPELVDKPVCVAGTSRRSVISTANYAAREFGVKSAMPISEALSLCPDLIVVDGHMELYKELSYKFFEQIRKYTDLVEVASIDECYADMSIPIKAFKRPLDLAWQIQQEVYQELKLKCSIGVAPNKFLAKMASNMRKPMGIVILRKSEVETKLWNLGINEMFGKGKKTSVMLKALGINTIGDLALFDDRNSLNSILGKNRDEIIDKCYGIASDEIITSTQLKSISLSTTFNDDIFEYEEIKAILLKLAIRVNERLVNGEILGNIITLSIRYFNFENIIRSYRLDYPTNDVNVIYETIMYLYDQNLSDKLIRHLGIGVGNLVLTNKVNVQLNIFNKANNIDNIIDDLNQKLTCPGLIKASSLKK